MDPESQKRIKEAAERRGRDRANAVAEGWELHASHDLVLKVRALPDGPLADDEAATRLVVARLFEGSPHHRRAIDLLEEISPEGFAATGVAELRDMMKAYRDEEHSRFKEVQPQVIAHFEGLGGDAAEAAQQAFRDLMGALDARRNGFDEKPKVFEVHHGDQVAREALQVALIENDFDADAALAQARRRFLLDGTIHDFAEELKAKAAPLPEPEM